MINRPRLIFLLVLLPISVLHASDKADMTECRARDIADTTLENKWVYRLNDTVSFGIGYDPALDIPVDFGARLMLLNKTEDAYRRAYYSKGSGDSYGMRLTFIENCGGNELLNLGEIGTEYSWGVRVFSYNDGKVEEIGAIPLAVEGEFDAVSVIPYMQFNQKNQSAFMAFTRDFIRNPGSLNEQQIPKTSIRYQIDHSKLTEIEPQEAGEPN